MRYQDLLERTPEETDAILSHYPEWKWRICPSWDMTDADLQKWADSAGLSVDDPQLRECGCLGCVGAMARPEWGRGPSPAEFRAWETWRARRLQHSYDGGTRLAYPWVAETDYGYGAWRRPLSDDEVQRIHRWIFPLPSDVFDFDPPDDGHLRYLLHYGTPTKG
jgi:hypothetical protein